MDDCARTKPDHKTLFTVVRHGQTIWNAQGQWQGWLDSPLTELGVRQARAAAESLKSAHFNVAFSSDSGRALSTAKILVEGRDLKVQPAEALRERFYGEYEGLTSDEIDVRYPGTRYTEGIDRRDTWRPVGGESLVEVSARVLRFLKELAGMYPNQNVLLVTHSGVVRILDALSSGQALDDIWMRTPLNCCVFRLEGDSRGNLRSLFHFCPEVAGLD